MLRIEFDARDATGRVGSCEWEGRRAGLPGIIAVLHTRFPTPDRAEIAIVPAGGNPPSTFSGILLRDRGSLFAPSSTGGGDGPELSVPADYPVSYLPPSMATAATAKNIELAGGGPVLVLGEAPAEPLGDHPSRLVVASHAVEHLGDPKRLVPYLVRIRESIGHQRLLYAPGTGLPAHLALLTSLTVDLVDSTPLLLAARRGLYLTEHGAQPVAKVRHAMCHCTACAGGTPTAMRDLALHNWNVALAEVHRIREAIAFERFREFVEMRIRAEPWLVAALREFDFRHGPFQETRYAVVRSRCAAVSRESLFRPDVVRWRERLRTRYRRPAGADVLLLVPCSYTKPYSRSASHEGIHRVLDSTGREAAVHTVVVTSPLGVVPGELELVYPAQQYDIAVTGDWDPDERQFITEAVTDLIARGAYRSVVAFLPGMDFLREALGPAATPAIDWIDAPSVRDDAALARLAVAVRTALQGVPQRARRTRILEDLRSCVRYQYGPAGEHLLDGTEVGGRPPRWQLFRDRTMVASAVPERGMIVPTLEGARSLEAAHCSLVEIEDFSPKGSVFAVGVIGADASIRPGDEVVLVHGSRIRGVGTAVMSGPEMVDAEAGLAVRVRHSSA